MVVEGTDGDELMSVAAQVGSRHIVDRSRPR